MDTNDELFDLLLISIRDSKNPETDTWQDLTIKGYDPETIRYHLKLLLEKELINGRDISLSEIKIIPKSLTKAGHDYIDERTKPFYKKIFEKMLDVSGKMLWMFVGGLIGGVGTYVATFILGVCK